jgi:glycosyltransferase involved in cell wall biosynthesis
MKKVAIVLDSIPTYRIPFFEELHRLGELKQIKYIVYTSTFNENVRQQNFSTEYLENKFISFPRRIFWHTKLEALDDADLIIMEQALHNPKLSWRFILNKNASIPTAFWGHGGYWTKKNSSIQEKILWKLVAKVDAFFAYSEEGAIRLVEHGFPLNRIAVLRNSVNSSKIYLERAKISPETHKTWMEKFELDSTNLGCFIGDLRKEKHLNFLFKAIIEIRRQVPDFQMIFFGNEALIAHISKWNANNPWIKLGGIAGEAEKAQLSLARPILINPGRVGLIAVDSIAMATPLVTRILDYTHAPEIDFLSPPESICVSAADLDSYVSAVVNLLKDNEMKEDISNSLINLQSKFSIEQMASRFHKHVLELI